MENEGAEYKRETGLEVKGAGLISKVIHLKYMTGSLTWCCEIPRLFCCLLEYFLLLSPGLQYFQKLKQINVIDSHHQKVVKCKKVQ